MKKEVAKERTPTLENISTEIEKEEEEPFKLFPDNEKPKDWKISLKPASRTATIDNTVVCLYKSTLEQKDKKVIAQKEDISYNIDPLKKSHSAPLFTNRKFRVFIDPGHGGEQPGAMSKDKKLIEKEITLDISKRLSTYLVDAGFETKLSRTNNNKTLTLEERTDMAAKWNADIFVSVHINAHTSSIANGFETYILAHKGQLSFFMDPDNLSTNDISMINTWFKGNNSNDNNLRLGYAIHRRTVKTSRLPDRGLRRARYTVLRNAAMPAVLVECGYLSSPIDSKPLKTADYRERCARGIFQGICDYAYGRMAPGFTPAKIPPKNNSKKIDTQNKPNEPISFVLGDTPTTTNRTPEWTPSYKDNNVKTNPETENLRKQALIKAGLIKPEEETNKTSLEK